MLSRPPEGCGHNAVHRLRHENPSANVVGGDDHCGGDKDAPVAVKREERQRSENVEVHFNPTIANMDQQGGHQHLSRSQCVSGDGLAGT